MIFCENALPFARCCLNSLFAEEGDDALMEMPSEVTSEDSYMHNSDGEASHRGRDDTAFEDFYEDFDDWAECLAGLKLSNHAGLAAAASGLCRVIDSLPDPSDLPEPNAMTDAEALAFKGGEPLFSPGHHDPVVLSALFTPQQIELYGFSLKHKWSGTQLLEMINLLQQPQFGVPGLDTDLHAKFVKLTQVRTCIGD